ncbi:hypothetical protein [Reyranella sp. CPCC 100927]|uniref:hypothetical protein n=1 Tax=Reyranella sp. CPCC 100927 TaxID=2599616 RepID=UPI0011B36F7E|nr:hypothetical protein [Reyranella sp. CPCC 100927]TWT00701.1 hypothetical protein FQU96_33130 [Reyranella sp. CPCC 100927]
MFEDAFKLKIRPDGLEKAAARTYVTAVRDVLEKIHRTACGKALLQSIRFHGYVVNIIPYPGADVCGADVDGDYDAATGIVMPTVRYTPGNFAKGGSCSHLPGRGWAESILFHELVHALRDIAQGKRRVYKGVVMTGGLHRYDTFEEFIAVLCEDIYVSERGNPHRLLGDHRGIAPLDPALADSFRFFATGSQTFRFVERFCRENPGFTKMLSRVPARFNPIAAYYKDPRKAQSFSNSPAAHERDADGVWGKLFERERSPTLPTGSPANLPPPRPASTPIRRP